MKEKKENVLTKEEMNLVEYPFQYLGWKVPPNVKTVEWHGEVVTRDGTIRQASWIVTGSDKYGLPRYEDRDVLLALLYFWKLQGFQSNILKVDSILDVLKVLRWDPSSKGYKMLEESLRRLVGVSIMANYSFWDNKSKDYTPSTGFHILDYYKFNRIGHRITLEVKASEQLWESITGSYLKTTNLDFYLSLGSPLLKSLYSYLDKKAYQNSEFTIEISKLAMHLGISPTRKPRLIKYDIKRAASELITRGFLDNFKIQGDNITFSFNKDFLTKEGEEQIEALKEKVERIIRIMRKEFGTGGMKEKRYHKIAIYYPEEFVLKAIDKVKNEDQSNKYNLFLKELKKINKEHFKELRKRLASKDI